MDIGTSPGRIILLGCRTHVYKSAIEIGLNISKIYALEGSHLHHLLRAEDKSFRTFKESDGKKILEELLTMDFDILISNGCPILFPVERFKKEQILLNIHPTYLPFLKGKTPLNGLIYNSHSHYGATIHFLDNGIDTGKILYQEEHRITPDLDLGLLYYLSMKLEGPVFKKGWQLLEESGFQYRGRAQTGKGSYFNRTNNKRTVNWETHNTATIIKKIQSFGLKSQGVFLSIYSKKYKVFEADQITNPELLKEAIKLKPGELFMEYDGKLLVKSLDGLIRIKAYELL
ncbi:formyltransferase family protein [Robiginitalea sp. IMCC44478]|uniref:formyltransferase family protein n=1 Tax=Robiginitalea sp. IMCC44478 TaxID=3459122 RepID=UPI004042849F